MGMVLEVVAACPPDRDSGNVFVTGGSRGPYVLEFCF